MSENNIREETSRPIRDVAEKQFVKIGTIKAPVTAYTSNTKARYKTSLLWEPPEWDLAECGRIIDVESFVRKAFATKKNLFLKEGYEFVGRNQDRVDYIRKRFLQIELATGIPTPILISRTVSSLINTSNAFWVKVRNPESSGGKVRVKNGKRVKPVAGYFLLPAETVEFKRNENGHITKYKQCVFGHEDKEFEPEDVIHFYFNKREGFSVGTPDLVPVRDDIRALRRIEENVELLVYQHLFPLFHYKVGTTEHPAEVYSDGATEVDVVRARVAEMPSDGCWVTPERHEIKAISTSGSPVAVENIIAHFKQRIFTGLGVSPVDLGEGGSANRSTAQTLSKNLTNDIKTLQQEFGAQFFTYVVQDLLEESTFPEADLFSDENKVTLKFNEIDLEARQAKENHYVDMYEKNAITHDEMRMAMGYDPFSSPAWPTPSKFGQASEDWQKTNYGLIKRDMIILQSIDEPGTAEASEETKSRSKANSAKTAESKSIANKNRPENQHGKRPSSKLNKDYADKHYASKHIKISNNIEKLYSSALDEIILSVKNKEEISLDTIQFNLDLMFSQAIEQFMSVARAAYRDGLFNYSGKFLMFKDSEEIIKKHVGRYIASLKNDTIELLKRNIELESKEFLNKNVSIIKSVFGTLKNRAKMIDETEIVRAYNFGVVNGFKELGISFYSYELDEESCQRCKNESLRVINLNDTIIYGDLAPFHPNCMCKPTPKH